MLTPAGKRTTKANTGFRSPATLFGGTPSEPLALCNANQKSCKHHRLETLTLSYAVKPRQCWLA